MAIPMQASSRKEINPLGTGSSPLYMASSSASLNSSNIRTSKKRDIVIKMPVRKVFGLTKPSAPLQILEYEMAEKLKEATSNPCPKNGKRSF